MLADSLSASATLGPLLLLGLAATLAQQAPAPSPEVTLLQRFVGEWDAQVSFPGAPAIPGRSRMRLLEGGTWLVEDFEAEMRGAPFRGHGLFGWDAARKTWTSVWVDNMKGTLTTSTGAWDEQAGRFVLRADMGTAAAPMPARFTWAFEGKDAFTFTIAPEQEGAPAMMTIRYARR